MKYNIILLIVAFFIVIHADEWKPKKTSEIGVLFVECLKKNSSDAEIKEDVNLVVFSNEEQARKFILCANKYIGLFDEVQGYHADRVAVQFEVNMEDKELLGIINGCIDKNEQKSSVEEWAFRGHECFMKSKFGDRVRDYVKKRCDNKT